MSLCSGMWGLFALTLLVGVTSLPQNPTASRSPPPIGETIKQLTNQLMEVNTTSQLTFDTRTPPRVKQQVKRDKTQQAIENSHPGIAEPIEDEVLVLEEATKKSFYKVEGGKPTTDSGLSTWILLSGQPSTTLKPNKKPINTTTVVVEDVNKVIKPIFKRKSSTSTTTKKPITILTSTIKALVSVTTPSSPTPTPTEKITKLTKIKASLVNTSGIKNSTQFGLKKSTTPKTTVSTTPTKKLNISEGVNKTGTEFIKISTKISQPINETIESNLILSPEAKDGTLDLTTQTTKKKRVGGSNKKKKNKNRRKRPTADDKIDNLNNTKIAIKNKEKPIGTQIYNYLSREVMPTVGVGLVGLMVTAGLASYFLYPFGPVRRSYEVDRKDKEVNYYYNDAYSGGIAEEEAIAKVIAGMPTNTNNYNTRIYNSRNTYPNRYRNVDQRYMQGSVETVHLNPHSNYKMEEVIVGKPAAQNFDINNAFKKVESTSKPIEDKKFVVGNVPKEFIDTATPVVVPEHGPRTLEKKEEVYIVKSVPVSSENEHVSRRKRQTEDESANEIDSNIKPTQTPFSTTTPIHLITTTKHPFVEKTESIIELLKDLFYFKLRIGLQMLQDKTDSLSKYFRSVQERIDMSYRETYQNQTRI